MYKCIHIHIQLRLPPLHLRQHAQGSLPLLALLAGADGRAEADDVSFNTKERLQPTARPSSADGCAEADDDQKKQRLQPTARPSRRR